MSEAVTGMQLAETTSATIPPETLRPVPAEDLSQRPSREPVVVMPTSINFDWPEVPSGESLIELLSENGNQVELSLLFRSLPRLLTLVEQWHQQGTAVLAPWSLRLTGDLVSAWCAPGMGGTVAWPEQMRRVSSHGPTADLHAIGMLVHRMASGRWAGSAQRAVVDAGILGGEWLLGADLAVISCLHPDAERRARSAGDLLDRLAPFIDLANRPAISPGTRVQVADESTTGWSKLRGRPSGDNEDAAAWDWTTNGVVAAVFDGVSGAGDGGGRWAAHTLRRKLRARWRQRLWDPMTALEAAADDMGQPPRALSPDSCTVGIVVRVTDRELHWSSVGDCRLYLARPRDSGSSVSRLTPEDSLLAAALRKGRDPDPDDAGAITQALPQPRRAVSSGSVPIRLGDVVLLLTDGACIVPADEPGLDDWRFADVLTDVLADADRSHAALLVSLLCRRSEELGGEDNSTALAIVCGPIPPSIADRPGRAGSRVKYVAPLMIEE